MRPPRQRAAAPSTVARREISALADLPRPGKRGAPQAFGHKLFDILTNESPDVIAWNRAGNAFKVHDPRRFEALLGAYFRHGNVSSFYRQCNLYGFKKIASGPDAGSHAHPCFLREKPQLLGNVRRAVGVAAGGIPAPATVAATATKKGAKAAPKAAAKLAAAGNCFTAAPLAANTGSATTRDQSDNAVGINAEEAGDNGGNDASDNGGNGGVTDVRSDSTSDLRRFFFFDDNELAHDIVLMPSSGEEDSDDEFSPTPLADGDGGRSNSGGGASEQSATAAAAEAGTTKMMRSVSQPAAAVDAVLAAAAVDDALSEGEGDADDAGAEKNHEGEEEEVEKRGFWPLTVAKAAAAAASIKESAAAAAAVAAAAATMASSATPKDGMDTGGPGTPTAAAGGGKGEATPGLVEQLASIMDNVVVDINSWRMRRPSGRGLSFGGSSSCSGGGGGGSGSLGGGNGGERSGTTSGRPSLDRMSFDTLDADCCGGGGGAGSPDLKGMPSPSGFGGFSSMDLTRDLTRDWDAFFGGAVEGFAEFFSV